MPTTNLNSFLETMAGIATGSLQGKAQAVKEAADQNEQTNAASQRLLLARMKEEADRANEIRGRAFTYATTLQKVIEDPGNLKYAQDNNLLPQFHREIGNGLSVGAGQTHYSQWRPQFAFDDQPGGGPATVPGGGTPQQPPAAPPPRPAPPMGGMTPGLAGPLPGAGGGPFGPTPPQPSQMSMPTPPVTGAPPTGPRTAFGLTPAQGLAERAQTESEAQGASGRKKTEADTLLAKKKFNFETAVEQLNQFMRTAEFRRSTGKQSFDASTGIWKELFGKAAEFSKAGGNPAAILRSLLHTPSPLGGSTMNMAAAKAYVAVNYDKLIAAGLTDEQINAMLADPSLGNTSPNGTALQTPQSMLGVGTGEDTSRGNAPQIPAVGIDPAAAALRSRSAGLASGGSVNRAGATAVQQRLLGDPHAIAAIQQMAPEARRAALMGFDALNKAGLQFTVNSTARSHAEQAGMVDAKKRGRNPLPVAPVGSSTHEAGLAIDLSNTGGGDQKQLAEVLAPLGWKWAGPKDPVHFTFIGTPQGEKRAGAAPGKGKPGGPASTPGGPIAPPPAAVDNAAAVGVKTPATAAPEVNPYPKGSFGDQIHELLVNGQHTAQELIDAYAGNPPKQKTIAQVADRIKANQASHLMPNIPQPSMMGAEVPTKEGINSLGNLMYNDPEVGKPDITTTPLEPTPLTAPEPKPAPADTGAGTGKDKQKPDTAGKTTGSGAKVDQPRKQPATSKAAPHPLAVPPPPSRYTGSPPKLTTVPPPGRKLLPAPAATAGGPINPNLTGTLRRSEPATTKTPGQDQQSAILTPADEKPELVPNAETPRGAKDFQPLSSTELEALKKDLQPYLKTPYRKGIDRWMNRNGINSLQDRRFYYMWVHRDFVPGLLKQGLDPRDVAQHLDHYLTAHQSFRPLRPTAYPQSMPSASVPNAAVSFNPSRAVR